MTETTGLRIEALGREEGGVQINISRSGVSVSLRDTPLIKAKGKSIDEAVDACWRDLFSSMIEYEVMPFYLERMREKRERLLAVTGSE